MPFLLLLFLTAACLPFRWPRPPEWVGSFGQVVSAAWGGSSGWESVVGSIVLTWCGVGLVVMLAALSSRWVCRQLAYNPDRRDVLRHRHATARLYHFIGQLLIFGLALHVLGWGWVVQGGLAENEASADPWPGSELLALAPFLIGLVLSWACFYDAERALHDAAGERTGVIPPVPSPYWGRWEYLVFHVRHHLALVFVPLLLLIIVNHWPRMIPATEAYGDSLVVIFPFLAIPAVLTCMPWVVRLVLALKPIPAGPLRNRLLAAARRLGFRCSNILLWNTRGGIANALVIGILPIPRYVVLSDRLIAEMTSDEVEAVFGHEVGHVKHHHMLYYLTFLMVSLTVLALFWEASGLKSTLGLAREHLAILPLNALLGTYIFVVFGFLSRRCERQADIYGCRAVSCALGSCQGHEDGAPLPPGGRYLCPTGIRTFISALEKVADLNGISRDRPGWLQSWQHSTIARRVEFLQRVLADPRVEPRFQRTVMLVKCAFFLGLGALIVFLGVYWGWAHLNGLLKGIGP
jgi:Zn-dependent protease with chaperone function